MKSTIYKYLIPLMFFSSLVACKDDFLIEKPSSFLSPPTTYTTDAGLAAGAVGLYNEFSFPYFGSSNWENCWVLLNGATDFNQMGNQKTNIPMATLSNEYGASTSDDVLHSLWAYLYRIVNNATAIVDYSETHEWQNKEMGNTTSGEAHFFRGWGNFYLTMLWGDIPIVDTVITSVRVNFVRNPHAEVLAYVIKDFARAANLLPETAGQPGRIDKTTAMHMLSYAYLANKQYDSAEVWAQAAVNDPNHSLVTTRFGTRQSDPKGNSFWDLFQLNNQNNNPEGLFVMQVGNTDLHPQNLPASGGDASRFVRELIPQYEQASGLLSSAQYGGRGYGRNVATMGWYSLFESNDIRGQMPNLQKIYLANQKATLNGKTINIGDTVFDFDNPQNGLYPQDAIILRPYPTKWNKEADPTDSTKYSADEIGYTGGTIRDAYIIRLSETYLYLAWAQLMQGKTDLAADNINVVRSRAGASLITPGDVTVDFILDELAREEWGEWYSRKVDLFISGKYIERVKKYNPEAGPNVADKHTLLPIPQSEIDLNSGAELTQNPGW